MNRRNFFKFMGSLMGMAALAPSKLLAIAEKKCPVEQYESVKCEDIESGCAKRSLPIVADGSNPPVWWNGALFEIHHNNARVYWIKEQ